MSRSPGIMPLSSVICIDFFALHSDSDDKEKVIQHTTYAVDKSVHCMCARVMLGKRSNFRNTRHTNIPSINCPGNRSGSDF
jgi:hypothetical protein